MASRPCEPDADAKRIWRRLLPDTPFPACGVRENVHAIESAAPANEATTDSKSAHARSRVPGNDGGGGFGRYAPIEFLQNSAKRRQDRPITKIIAAKSRGASGMIGSPLLASLRRLHSLALSPSAIA